MKKALISPSEKRYDNNGNEGVRIAAVVEEEFPVAEPLYWVDCSDQCVQDKWIYINGEFVEVLPPQLDLPEPNLPISTIITI
jgi:hypothetical protein